MSPSQVLCLVQHGHSDVPSLSESRSTNRKVVMTPSVVGMVPARLLLVKFRDDSDMNKLMLDGRVPISPFEVKVRPLPVDKPRATTNDTSVPLRCNRDDIRY